MIEQGLYFGLGCAVAGLLSLGFLPVLWARALRLTRQRLQVQIPVTMQEILADRDHLRADLAVERRKLEQDMERVRAAQARAMGDLGRRTVEVTALTDALADSRMTKKIQAELIETLQRDMAGLDAQRGALAVALHGTHEHFEQRMDEFAALRRSHSAMEAGIEQRRTTIAGLNTRAMGLEMTIEDAERSHRALERQWEASGAALRNDLDRARARIAALEAELAAAVAVVQDAKEREKGIHLQKSLRAERARGAGRADLEKIDALQADNAALRGALDAARRQARDGRVSDGDVGDRLLRRSGGEPDDGDPSTEGDAMLRASIHDIGLAVARMAAVREGEQVAPTSLSAAPPMGSPEANVPV